MPSEQPSKPRKKTGLYRHTVDLKEVTIPNLPPSEMVERCRGLEYRGYQVENLADGRKIVITKPGGKITFGSGEKEDFFVWVFDPLNNSLWLISHKEIYEDLAEKGRINPDQCVLIINALERVFHGEDPEVVLRSPLPNPGGELPELLLKAYKWIWVQEDCNYPGLLGRRMSFEGRQFADGIIARQSLIALVGAHIPNIVGTLKKEFPRASKLKINKVAKVIPKRLRDKFLELLQEHIPSKSGLPKKERGTGLGLMDLRASLLGSSETE